MTTLLAWDFDWSLIEENSDTFVITKLGADAIYKAGREGGMPWTRLMDHTLKEAARQLGHTRADVEAALHATPLHPALADVLNAAAASDGDDTVEIMVLSDANTVYIETILAHHGLRQLVAAVHTNPARWDAAGALRVRPYHTEPHGCRHCPANLCKGKVLLEFLERRRAAGRQYNRVLYVGDGRGDFCPAQLLLHGATAVAAVATRAGGAAGEGTAAAAAGTAQGGGEESPCGGSANRVFARAEYPDGAPCSLWVMLLNEAGGAADSGSSGAANAAADAAATPSSEARVVPWRRPDELAELLRCELGLPVQQLRPL